MKYFLFIILVLSMTSFSYAADESVELTTYYPAPYGDYEELTTSSNTFLAIDSGNVGIGTTAPNTKLHIVGGVTKTEGGLILPIVAAGGTTPTEDGSIWIQE